MKEMLTVAQARQEVLAHVERLDAKSVTVHEAAGYVAGQSFAAPADFPSFDNSAMDGVAFLAGGTEYNVVGTSAAGVAFDGIVKDGQAVRIMTGARVPDGADTVVPVENCEFDGDVVRVSDVQRGAHIRQRGCYARRGDALISSGDEITPASVGVLASFGRSMFQVVRRPTVAIVTTGDELVEIDGELGSSQIYNSNAHLLRALCEQAGCQVEVLPTAADSLDAILTAFRSAARRADIVISVGGVSMGDFDFTRTALETIADAKFWRIRMKPGKPLSFGTKNGVMFLGLPGNPVSAFVCFQVFVKAVIARMSGRPVGAELQTVSMTAADEIRSTPKRLQFVTGQVSEGVFSVVRDQSSGNVFSPLGATALGIIPDGESIIAAGGSIEVLVF